MGVEEAVGPLIKIQTAHGMPSCRIVGRAESDYQGIHGLGFK
jgi:hypothetical protein